MRSQRFAEHERIALHVLPTLLELMAVKGNHDGPESPVTMGLKYGWDVFVVDDEGHKRTAGEVVASSAFDLASAVMVFQHGNTWACKD